MTSPSTRCGGASGVALPAELDVLSGGRLVRTIPVGIGAPDSPTPMGRFAVAEKLTGPFGPAYGPRILVLTARQPRLPPGWNRSVTYYVAIHSGSGQGSAVSAGGLHATEAEVRWLMRTVPLGTPVLISGWRLGMIGCDERPSSCTSTTKRRSSRPGAFPRRRSTGSACR